jgi:hypothetical protein
LKASTQAEGPAAIPAGCATTAGTGPGSTDTPPADALEGEWHQTFTCDEAREAVEGAVAQAEIEGSGWTCDLPGKQVRIARFGGGRLVLLDPPAREVGLTADYELLDDHTFALSDGGENIPDAYRFGYRIEGEELTVDVLEEDPFFVGAWEAAPFVRVE